MSTVTIRSPAKLNLFLEVTGRREDGFHELQTVMVRTDICDVMRFTRRTDDRFVLTCVDQPAAAGMSRGNDIAETFPLDDSNLIIRAAKLLQEHSGVRTGVSIQVNKRIPAEAGLGGGSGNAATTLRTLNMLWQSQLSDRELHSLAAHLGSDINFLLSGYRAAFCSGRGEVVEPVQLNGSLHGVLVVPVAGNSTAEVFRALDGETGERSPEELLFAMASGDLDTASDRGFNRLQAPACQINKQIDSVLSRLSALNGSALMTGSGAACFTLTETAGQAQRLLAGIQNSGYRMVTDFRC